jgi:hypothetical protein
MRLPFLSPNQYLDGLQRKAERNQANAEDAHAFLGHMICNP